MAKSPLSESVNNWVQTDPFGQNLGGATRRSHRRQTVPSQADHRASQSLIKCARGEWRNTRHLDASVERFMVDLEAFIVGTVARLMDVVDRHYQTWPILVAAHTAGRLNVFGARLR